jgi:cobalt-zinc-cadmium efflux system outer membrane protein
MPMEFSGSWNPRCQLRKCYARPGFLRRPAVKRPSCPALMASLMFTTLGCAQADRRANDASVDGKAALASYDRVDAIGHHQSLGVASVPSQSPADLSGPQPVDAYVRRALAENRTVQAAYHNVESLRYRIPQVTALDDPVAANTIFPIPSVAPQYSLMGYNPYNLSLVQQFPWFGTLRLRGEVADRDVRVALAELAAAELDAITAVKRAYFELHAAEKTEANLNETRKILQHFHAIARSRLALGGSQQDVIRAETLINELDRTLAGNEQEVASARAALARQIHVSPDADLRTLPELPIGEVPAEIDRLYELAVTARPELQGRLEAIARDQKAVELARKRFYPNLTLGVTYMDMTKANAVTPTTASGSPNVGLFVGFNLPVYHKKYKAGVHEAQERALADAKLYEAQQDETNSDIKDFLTQAKVQQNVLNLLRDGILPRARHTLELAKRDYENQNVDIATVLSAEREVLQVEIQTFQVEAEMGKALASLERAVGCQISDSALEPSQDRNSATILPTTPAAAGPFPPASLPSLAQ